MSVLVKSSSGGESDGIISSGNMLLVKGAAESIIDRSKFYQTPDGSINIITSEMRLKLYDEVRNLQSKPSRVLGLAYQNSETLQGGRRRVIGKV